MNDTPRLPHAGRLIPSGRHYRSTSQSPTRPRQVSDDLLSHLSPMNAIEAFRTPSGSLKTCMDAASATEQAFAMRAALASKNIYEWLDELEEWPWPEEGGSTGFEAPLLKRRKLSFGRSNGLSKEVTARPSTPTKETVHLGSLPAADVLRYERRIDEIQHDMDELDVDEIKQHVLHNHILPLSRPGTPMSDNRSATSSFSSYNRMDDLTATVTATVVQALPNLSKLTRLMNTWIIRLAVLRRVPSMLKSLSDAEVAIQSGWNAIELGAKSKSDDPHTEIPTEATVSTLSRKDFEIMKLVLEKKVAKAARDLDYMLDTLEGREDTLPDEWCDRMDAAEQDYSSWVAACEKKIQEAQWMKFVDASKVSTKPTREADKKEDLGSKTVATESPQNDNNTESRPNENVFSEQSTDILILNDTGGDISPFHQDSQKSISPGNQRGHENASQASINSESLSRPQTSAYPDLEKKPSVSRLEAVVLAEDKLQDQDGEHTTTRQNDSLLESESVVSSIETPELFAKAQTDNSEIRLEPIPTVQISPAKATAPLSSEIGDYSSDSDPDFDLDDPTERVGQMDRELSLPPLNHHDSRPSTSASDTSTVIHPLSHFRESSNDLPGFVETPELPQMPQMQDTEELPSDQISPPSSPPGFRTNTRASSVSFIDMPPLTEASDDDTPPKTPLESSFMDDNDFSQDMGSPGKMSQASNADDQLQQQISEILESIPAKIHLSSQPSAINLNPPDIQLPYTKPRPVDRSVRSLSSLSSRASTPSFMLAPAYAKNARPRHQRGNQEIKLYHLSRSTGEPPIKLFIRCVGENGERVMVRVGGGWADLGEYLKDYASHHGRRSGAGNEGKVEIRDLPRVSVGRTGSSPPSRPASAMDSPITPLNVRKTRKSVGEESAGPRFPKTPLATALFSSDPPSSGSTRSRSSSRLSWTEEDSSLGMAGPKAKNIEMSDESKAWVESVKEKVRIASGERKPPETQAEGKFGELGKVGGTKRLFRRGPG